MTFASSTKGIAVSALVSLASTVSGATFVYVSNAEDGTIGVYRMNPGTGELQAGESAKAANLVMPMAVSPNRRFLYAAIRSKPYAVMTYSIDAGTGALRHVSTSPLAESFPYISLDKKGRYLFGASYGAHVVSVNAVGPDGKVSEPLQVIPIGRNAHSIRTDESNKYVYVPSLGSDQIFQFAFDEKTGRLASNTPAVVLLKPLTGPRHFIISRDNRFLYALNELLGTVTTFSLDGKTGLLTEVASVSGLPPDTKLGPGMPRGAVGGANAPPPRNTDNDVWAADIHATPNGKFIYITERTTSSICALSVNEATGALAYLGCTPTEKQPRGFAIDARGKYLVASGEKSGTISVYAIDAASGALRPVGQYPTGKGSNWVEIVSFD
jgi:6-phosphogluconolactonase